ncbi:unnamed protein product [Spirodela intermedia]|uniref:UBC core domain-containing protein n=1 Tax=Spirodela intermedia TaxID=51605 RepID=A0A7I8I940_SPIIN|nr:unnamed protein product [Spirodela intermedia]CAA6653953.1 unnamed protein product [Spirodela intermedia]
MSRRENQDVQDTNIPSSPVASPAPPAAADKHPLQVAKTVDGQAVLKRLQSELMALMMCGDAGISAFPEAESIACWKGTISGSRDTVYEGTTYKLSLIFPKTTPSSPQSEDKWSSAYDVRTILLSIQSLLGEPNNESPLNPQAAALWSNQEEFRKMLMKLFRPSP